MPACEHDFPPQSAGEPECSRCGLKRGQWLAQFTGPAPDLS